MALKSQRQQELHALWILLALGAFLVAVLFTTFWFAKPDVLMDAYKTVRLIQFGSFWDELFPQARQLIAETENGVFSLSTLAKSSVPSAVLSGIGILTVGLFAYERVSKEHLDAFITHKTPPSMMEILDKFAIFKPAVRFVLNYKDHKLSSAKGDGRLPHHPLSFLQEHEFLKRIGPPAEWNSPDSNPDFPEPLPFAFLEVDKAGIQAYFSDSFGPRNPFLGLKNMNDLAAVRSAVDALPFHLVLVMAPALARVHYSIFFEEKDYVRAVLDLHKFPDEVWTELNAMKAAEGGRLRLGFDDQRHRVSENSLWLEANKKASKDLITLSEYLKETITVDGQEVVRGDAMKTVLKARELMWDVLTMHRLEDRKRWPVGQDENAKFIWKETPPETAAEKAYLEKVTERLIRASEECDALMRANAYCFGVLGTLVERTRKMGVYVPNVWRWMRFVELAHWRFFLDLGKPLSTVDSMGMWEHYNAETAIGEPIHSPFLRRTANDLARQAARFVTKEFTSGYNRTIVMDDTGASFDLEALYREVDAQEKAGKREVQDALDVGTALSDFDPAAAMREAAGKPIQIKTSTRRIVT
ncbi:hypothetical protein [uncultured Tateyamaria sp.]|uniref:secretion/conjugation apparatus DotM-related subunit n=1 Tax=uncultured Tateyamaria sp. TaxID=455651 RepID=UPI002619AB64|nr:hypothetical protein [uncultured Tateyamaria sp.]